MARAIDGLAALLFVGSAAVTVTWCASMTGMAGMDMPGGWTMSMTWMRMPGQSWPGAALTFLGMWTVMMVAMMLPALTPAVRGFPPAMGARVAAAYFAVWISFGLAAYPLGLLLAELAMRVPALARLVPALAGVALAGAGVLQLSAWKRRQLDCCGSLGRRRRIAGTRAAWRHGIALGLRCCACCAPLTAALLVVGVMDLGAMAAATAAIALERLAPRGPRFARLTGVLLLGAAAVWLLRVPG